MISEPQNYDTVPVIFLLEPACIQSQSLPVEITIR
jgi:hypothetical protein